MLRENWLDRVAKVISPSWALNRTRARVAVDLLERNYEAARVTRRTDSWRRSSTDANAAIGPSLARLRDLARDIVRNNPYAESAIETIVDNTIGTGIQPVQQHDRFREWSESTEIDADGCCDLYGLEKQVMRSVAQDGEVLVRQRFRRLEDGLAIPLQLQILEADHIDTFQHGSLPNGGRIIHGIEFDPLGRRVAYHLFREHPGSTIVSSGFSSRGSIFGQSRRIPANEIIHIYDRKRPAQVRGPSWFAPILIRLKDFDEYEDATLVKQKIAACLTVLTTDVDGTGAALGNADSSTSEGQTDNLDRLGPGWIGNLPPGRDVEVVQPPRNNEYADYTKTTLRAIATGIGVTYEDLTGDYTNLPFSAARMSRLRFRMRIDDWRWRIVVPQFLDPVWSWAMTATAIAGGEDIRSTEWTAPALPMIEPDKEGLAMQRNIRTGIQTVSEAIRERGYNPDTFLEELANDFKKLDELGLVLDCDPRRMTQAGQAQTLSGAALEDEKRFAQWLGQQPVSTVERLIHAVGGKVNGEARG